MKRSGIYRIALADGRCYVGQSCNMHRRWNEHRSRLRRGTHWLPHLQNAWNKYGEDAFTFAVLEECEPGRMTEREQWWMDSLRPAFNVAPRAESLAGYKRPFRNLTPAHRAKISAAHKGKTVSAERRAALSAARRRAQPVVRIYHWAPPKPRTLSHEHRAKIAAALTGRTGYYAGKTLSAEHRARIAASKMGKKPTEAARASMRAAQKRRHERERAAKAVPQSSA